MPSHGRTSRYKVEVGGKYLEQGRDIQGQEIEDGKNSNKLSRRRHRRIGRTVYTRPHSASICRSRGAMLCNRGEGEYLQHHCSLRKQNNADQKYNKHESYLEDLVI